MARRPAPVALLTTYYKPVVGGVEAAAEHLARHLARRGHPITVVTKRVSSGDPPRETVDGVAVHRTGPVGPRRPSGKWLALPGFVKALWQKRRSWRLICCVDYRGIGIAALLLGMLTGAPVVFETSTDGTISGEAVRRRIHRLGLPHDGAIARLATWPIRSIYGRADLFLCVSRQLERELVASGVPAARIRYLPHTVDRTRFTPVIGERQRALRLERRLPPDRVTAIFVGRLSREKGIRELVDAWAGLDRDAHLVVVGPHMDDHPWNEGPALRASVRERCLDARVTFAGGVAAADVPGWMQCADFAIVPSHFEAFGIAAAEAMAVGLPVVASDVGGLRDFVETGVNGIRVPPRNVEALQSAIRTLIDNPGLRQSMSLAAQKTAERFDERLVLEQIAAAFDELVDRRAEGFSRSV